MVKKIYFIRHANAEDQQRGERDFDRQLSREGYKNAAHVGRYFAQHNIRPDVFLSSPAVRAKQTTEIVADQIKFDTSAISFDEEIYEGSARILLRIINSIEEKVETVFMVAHNPGITFIAEYLTGGQIGNMDPSGITEISASNLTWAAFSQQTCKLEKYISPDELNKNE